MRAYSKSSSSPSLSTSYVIIALAVLSWLIAFNVVNIRNDLVRSIWNMLDALTTPLLRPIRRLLPNMGGIDISPVILFLLILLVEQIIGDLYLSLRLLSRDERAVQNRRRPLLRGFPDRRDARPCDAAHHRRRRRLALFRALRAALRGRRPPRPSPGPRLSRSPVDDLLAFHVVFGKTVPDVSLNAIANLGYAACRFLDPVYPGDTLTATSEVVGLKENSSRQSGVVYVRTRGFNQDAVAVLDYVRWVMVRKRDAASPAPRRSFPICLTPSRPRASGTACRGSRRAYDFALAGSPHRWGDYAKGERIDHVDGVTVEEAEHQIATRLFQNNAKVHFNQFSEGQGRFGRRLVYGGHVISLARALSSTASPMRFTSRRSMPGAMSRRCSPATRSSPGARSSTPRRSPVATTSARCACARSRPRIAPAPISRRAATRAMTPA